MLMLNLGCGDRYASGWKNLDFVPIGSDVQCHNLLEELPFADNSVDVVYNSHVLEHFSPSQASIFLNNCYRKLKQGGIFRIVVPDLENICIEYLKVLNHAYEGTPEYINKYHWIIIELLDQMVRNKSGGEMAVFWDMALQSEDTPMIDYIRERTGRDIYLQTDKAKKQPNNLQINLTIIKHFIMVGYTKILGFLLPTSLRENVFNQTPIGERHCWMYDRFSLKNLLEHHGFSEIQYFNFDGSRIQNFNDFFLDRKKDLTPYKKSSLYCEAIKLNADARVVS